MLPRLIWSIVFLAALADVGARLIPPQYLAFRAWEAMAIYPYREGPFTPLSVYDKNAYGDLANLANLPALRQYRQERFTTDEYGFRNPPGTAAQSASVLLLGDSFAAGSGLTDSDTLGAQLAKLSGLRVYNAAGVTRWSVVSRLLQRLGMKQGLVIFEVSERFDLPDSFIAGGANFSQRLIGKFLAEQSPWFQRAQVIGRLTQSLPAYSPLRITARRAVATLEDDQVFPRLPQNPVVQKQLNHQTPILFFRSEIDNFHRVRPVSAKSLVEMRMLVESTGNRFLVLLVPDKYHVYFPWLSGEAPTTGPSYLDVLAGQLQAANTPVLNLTPALRDEAAAALANRSYVYYLDDTHWNPRGVHRAAQEILKLP